MRIAEFLRAGDGSLLAMKLPKLMEDGSLMTQVIELSTVKKTTAMIDMSTGKASAAHESDEDGNPASKGAQTVTVYHWSDGDGNLIEIIDDENTDGLMHVSRICLEADGTASESLLFSSSSHVSPEPGSDMSSRNRSRLLPFRIVHAM